MGGRLALVVGAECAALGRLGFVDELATDLYTRLHRLGGWRSAIAMEGPVLDPTVDELKAAIAQACSAASQQQATLLISFIGHGIAVHRNLFLLAKDSDPGETIDSDKAYNLGQGIIEKLIPARLDGLIVLVDACEAGAGAKDAHRWIEVIDPAAGRIEVLTASDEGNAYNGCFTRTMLSAFEQGLPEHGTYLLPADLRPRIAQSCTRQTPRQLSSAVGGDPGLWLVPNVSRVNDAVFDRPQAGFVDQLTKGPAIGAVVKDRAAAVFAASEHRLRVVVGPAGCGKSTLMSLLIRPHLLPGAPFTADYVTAAVFLDLSSTAESFVEELANQLRRRVDGYREAVETVNARYLDHADPEPDSVELDVLLPLALVRPRFGQITIIVDGLDQPESGSRDQVVTTIAQLTSRASLAHVRVIVGLREGTGIEDLPQLSPRHHTYLPSPADSDLLTAVLRAHAVPEHDDGGRWTNWVASLRSQTSAGGWLLARLMVEIPDLTDQDRTEDIDLRALVHQRIQVAVNASGSGTGKAIAAILGVLAAAGSGPVLPLELLDDAVPALGLSIRRSQIRDLVAGLGVLISRGNPGTEAEVLGLAHTDFGPSIHQQLTRFGIRIPATHRAILTALDAVRSDAATRYARGSAVRHYLAIGDSRAAFAYLLSRNTANAADNRARWASWLHLFTDSLGPDHPHTLTARHNLAYWRGESGDTAGAVAAFERLLTDSLRALDVDHPHVLKSRSNLILWRGQNGDVAGAVLALEQLVADCVRVLGPAHPDTLVNRDNLAYLRQRLAGEV
ncbi:tetratricopeptide repeat protein [Nocardia altamirensis]|uniref:tetratricopeptide repeat protein n=1 Tax=Nocardia altamirensis TaxID=472158 RepID=UPI00083FFC78|nr:tetratricopeptide repeat protein [Nocardia altamirensis]